MNIRQSAMFLLALTGAVVGVRAETSVKSTFDIVQDRENALYGCGETATFTVRVADGQGGALTNGLVAWTLDNFGSEKVGSGSADLAKANPFTVRGKLDEPGFLRLTARCGGASKVWSVGYDVGRIRQVEPCPTDFDDYWQGEKARLAREVPLDARCEKVDRLSSAARDTFLISFATFNGTRLWGFMTVPADREYAPFRAVVRICDAGTGATGPWSDRTDEITVTLNVFPFKPAANGKEQQKLLTALNDRLSRKYGLRPGIYCANCGIGESREDYFFHDAMLGLARAVASPAGRPEVDPQRLEYLGSGQRGGERTVVFKCEEEDHPQEGRQVEPRAGHGEEIPLLQPTVEERPEEDFLRRGDDERAADQLGEGEGPAAGRGIVGRGVRRRGGQRPQRPAAPGSIPGGGGSGDPVLGTHPQREDEQSAEQTEGASAQRLRQRARVSRLRRGGAGEASATGQRQETHQQRHQRRGAADGIGGCGGGQQ